MISHLEILETNKMIREENLDIRTVTMGIDLLDVACDDLDRLCNKIYDKIAFAAKDLVKTADEVALKYAIPIVNKRIAITPIALVAASTKANSYVKIAKTLDRVSAEVGVNFIGGFSALVDKGYSNSAKVLVSSLAQSLSETERVCASVNVGSTRTGINMDVVKELGEVIKNAASLTADRASIACAKFVVFCNAPDDNPFMAGAFHGVGQNDTVIHVGVSGPGVVKRALMDVRGKSFEQMCECIKRTSFKMTRAGQMVAKEVAENLGVPFGIIDLSLAPTPAIGDSVAEILEEMGLSAAGAPGSTLALAILNDAVKKGGVMASSRVGGLSGAFIPVSEDHGMIEAAQAGLLTLEKLEAMTCVCSVGLDMIAIPGDTSASTISGIIGDEMAIGMINGKTTAVRIIPAAEKNVGDEVEFGGLLGTAPIMAVNTASCEKLIARGGRVPAPIHSFKN
ncbi:PFL family protein [Candidatus Epulonipiscium viviparus]|uniref:PFL family protein n=1 Tax=Candidatus Epulonipiscium viviparus TaxID=420336 RepID=UPI0027381684|nr:PFL family protein [Candidatus Epulopiscium viviparus]